ncbi:hypothetical protein B0H14DRAFT_2617889 [Mycena olivaceomarginata]|nr:hypothetical protein B0H14DRAFT_2617889 [Mycena olivaceomarginata]
MSVVELGILPIAFSNLWIKVPGIQLFDAFIWHVTDIDYAQLSCDSESRFDEMQNFEARKFLRIVTVRPGGRTAPKPAVQWTVRRRYGRAGSLTTPDGTGRWTGRPSTVDGRCCQRIDAPSVVRSRLRLSASGTQLEGNECGNQVGDSPFILCIFTAKAARYVDVVMNLAAKRQTPKTVLIHQHISPLVYLAAPQAAMRGGRRDLMGMGQWRRRDVAERCSRPSIRPRVDGTPVLTTVRRRDGGLRRPIAQRRDGTVVRPSVRPTVLDGYGDDPYTKALFSPTPSPEPAVNLNPQHPKLLRKTSPQQPRCFSNRGTKPLWVSTILTGTTKSDAPDLRNDCGPAQIWTLQAHWGVPGAMPPKFFMRLAQFSLRRSISTFFSQRPIAVHPVFLHIPIANIVSLGTLAYLIQESKIFQLLALGFPSWSYRSPAL